VVPCHRLNPKDALTKIEVMAMREEWNGFDKYIPRLDWWPKRVWDWQIPLPYRQAIALRDTIWLGGQVPSEPFSNTSKPMYPGNLVDQTRLVMSYLEDLLRGYDRSTADLKLMVCYFTCPDGAATTKLFLDTVAETIGGALPPTTLVPKPGMHTPMGTVEIWGVAQL
jgi:enamine deaminase RidA (YjgF/YER057c/UK114 family)